MQLLIIENNPILEENFTNQLSFDKKINFSYYSNINIIKEIKYWIKKLNNLAKILCKNF